MTHDFEKRLQQAPLAPPSELLDRRIHALFPKPKPRRLWQWAAAAAVLLALTAGVLANRAPAPAPEPQPQRRIVVFYDVAGTGGNRFDLAPARAPRAFQSGRVRVAELHFVPRPSSVESEKE